MYQCNLCRYVFERPGALNYHLDERHNDNPPEEIMPPKYPAKRKHGNRRYSSEYGRKHGESSGV